MRQRAIGRRLIIWIQIRFRWQATFVAMGAVGVAWLAPWLQFYETPERHPKIGVVELDLIKTDPAVQTLPIPWSVLLRHREARAVVLARFCADLVWWLYIRGYGSICTTSAISACIRSDHPLGWPFVCGGRGQLDQRLAFGSPDRARVERESRARAS
jgi:hypothetical protein